MRVDMFNQISSNDLHLTEARVDSYVGPREKQLPNKYAIFY